MAHHARETQRNRPTDLAGNRARISMMTSGSSTGASWLLSAVGAGRASSSSIPLAAGSLVARAGEAEETGGGVTALRGRVCRKDGADRAWEGDAVFFFFFFLF